MTPQQKMLVRTTFAQVLPIADTAAAYFYARLFELDPSVRPLFTGDAQEPGRKLMQTIAVAVRGLDDPDTLVPAVRAIGERHAGYGVRDGHYETVAVALSARWSSASATPSRMRHARPGRPSTGC